MSWTEILWLTGKMLLAFVLALPVGWDREHSTRSAGLRTFPLVALASCGYTLLGLHAFAETPEAKARILQGLITGIGFIGGGAIVKSDLQVRGTATATSIWTTGAIGAAVAFGRYEIAILLSLIDFVALRYLEFLKPDDERGGGGS